MTCGIKADWKRMNTIAMDFVRYTTSGKINKQKLCTIANFSKLAAISLLQCLRRDFN